MNNNKYDVIIIGGSYAGLSAAMALGRASRKVLVIDSGNPCNKQTPHSHNFITQDGETPAEIARKAKEQVQQYDTVDFLKDTAMEALGENNNFELVTKSGKKIKTDKLLFATGVRDIFPAIKGFDACWGISAIHCPYCHGYEFRNEPTGILSNGPMAYEYGKLISNWTDQLVIFTNGKSTIDEVHEAELKSRGIYIVESEMDEMVHQEGKLESIVMKDGSVHQLKALYSRPAFVQHCEIPEKLGCKMTEQHYIQTDEVKRTSVAGIYAAGDNMSPMRAVAAAVAAGNMAGAMLNKELIEDRF